MIALDFTVRQGSFELQIREELKGRVTALFGPSGAGKTTILDAVAGLRRPASGTIVVGDRVLFDRARGLDLPPHQRYIGYVPQDVALFPHMNVRRNVLYGRPAFASTPLSRLRRALAGARRAKMDRASARAADHLDLDAVAGMLEVQGLLDRNVSQLSGGERQRIALARALISGPALLLLDEPLAAVDLELRRRILPYLERVRDQLAVPILYVTHSREEVERIADWVIVLERGRVARAGATLDA